MLLRILTLLGSIGLFLYGMELMSSGMHKAFSDKLRSFLPWMNANPFKQLLAGAGVTALLQSSGVATIMVVGFVNTDVLTLYQAVNVIMGANIGTTITAWILSVFGFGIEIGAYAYAVLLAGFICMMINKPKVKSIGMFLLGFSLVFIGLTYLNDSFIVLAAESPINTFIIDNASHGVLSVMLFFIAGIFISVILQSSTATILLTLIFINLGWIDFGTAAAMVLGENIGTTLTAIWAASDTDTQARRAALAHTLFNITGVLIALILFIPFTWCVKNLCELIGLHNPVYWVAMFHTLFNLINACIQICFTKYIVILLNRIIKETDIVETNTIKLKYISAGRMATPSLSIEQAYKEVENFAITAQEGFQYVKKALLENNDEKFEEYHRKLVECEEITDKFEYEIADFLNGFSSESLTTEEAGDIKVLYRIIGELESLGDSCENISRIFSRLRAHKQNLDDDSKSKLVLLFGRVNQAFTVMLENLSDAQKGISIDIRGAYAAENNINTTRDTLREDCIKRIEKQTGNYQSLNYFLDLIGELEAMGDFIINVSQAIVKKSTE